MGGVASNRSLLDESDSLGRWWFLIGWVPGVVNFLEGMQCTSFLLLLGPVIDDSFLLILLLWFVIENSSYNWCGVVLTKAVHVLRKNLWGFEALGVEGNVGLNYATVWTFDDQSCLAFLIISRKLWHHQRAKMAFDTTAKSSSIV